MEVKSGTSRFSPLVAASFFDMIKGVFARLAALASFMLISWRRAAVGGDTGAQHIVSTEIDWRWLDSSASQQQQHEVVCRRCRADPKKYIRSKEAKGNYPLPAAMWFSPRLYALHKRQRKCSLDQILIETGSVYSCRVKSREIEEGAREGENIQLKGENLIGSSFLPTVELPVVRRGMTSQSSTNRSQKNGTSIQKVSNIKAIQRDERNRRTLPSVWPHTRAGVNNLFSKVRGAINQNGTKVVTSRQYTREKYEHNALANWSVWFGFRSDWTLTVGWSLSNIFSMSMFFFFSTMHHCFVF